MRLATITNWAYGCTVALALASCSTMLLASAAQDRERAAVAQRYELDHATSMISEEVFALSALARQYAVAGDASALAAYRHELKRLRVVEDRVKHIRDAGAGADELNALRDALRWTDALQDEQQQALTAAETGDRTTAINILFASEYERELDRVRSDIERFQYRIDQRTDAEVKAAISTSKLWRTASEVVLGGTGFLFLCVLFFVFRQRVLRPVVKLSDVVSRLAAQDYAAEPPEYEQIDEIGDMAQALRVFRENGIERQRLEQERDADRAMRDLISRMTQRMQRCDTLADLEGVIQRFAPEVMPELAGRLYLLDSSRNVLVEGCSWLDPVHSRAEFSPLSCWGLRRGNEHRASDGHVDVPCGHLEWSGDHVPESLCMPLTAQQGAFGLLYFEPLPGRRLSDGRDVYLKMLAENIALALDNLRLRDALRDLAMADPLTKLANRRQLDTMLEVQLTESERHGAPISCAMIDIDHFKRFNDDHGHDAGDAVLRAVGATLQRSIREGNLVFRYGGEEFLMLMPGMDVDQAAERAEEVRTRIAALHVVHDGKALGSITASVGVATAPVHCPRDRLTQTADAALLRAKQGGRNQVVVAATRMDERPAITASA
ncbi:MAG: sensor domain-containing diguanylate cyclase [Phenylobacterium sp.]|uniref:sensor domain-containing diguanylate cyclase n=1 Tax=Phenylobacterium sp. TaxID=1871053 RepID=UPI002735D0F4|nr:sensor domain-containing diguanylate cyclase [Phenylobacterium sp.]MDP3173775.1 sensor domain-containing diguanylate cyclase [Phenylobacterium sp.]